jgi:hypothetical protein
MNFKIYIYIYIYIYKIFIQYGEHDAVVEWSCIFTIMFGDFFYLSNGDNKKFFLIHLYLDTNDAL